MKFAVLIVSLAALPALAQETASTWKHESEASLVQVDGNTKTETYSAKQETTYTVGADAVKAKGRYLQTRTSGTETARAWDASLRYERALSERWSAFLQQGAESDPFAGYVQRDNTDLGAKYIVEKNDVTSFFLEAGARYTTENLVAAADRESYTGGRLYAEYERALTGSLTGKFWIEYLPNFKESDAYLLNLEPSLSVMISEIFSLKLSYLTKYHEKTTLPGEERRDTTFTTSLVAKF